ncbi:MAG: hypothetical protein N3D12_02870, partial [Candidatus Methanomethyliaceae archaeon]|nr:hypothetical protein [Candidatus Methanomethyliaceae archaeon]
HNSARRSKIFAHLLKEIISKQLYDELTGMCGIDDVPIMRLGLRLEVERLYRVRLEYIGLMKVLSQRRIYPIDGM